MSQLAPGASAQSRAQSFERRKEASRRPFGEEAFRSVYRGQTNGNLPNGNCIKRGFARTRSSGPTIISISPIQFNDLKSGCQLLAGKVPI